MNRHSASKRKYYLNQDLNDEKEISDRKYKKATAGTM